MFRPRIIPVLLLDGQALVKTVRFGASKYVGDPVNAVRLFNDLHVDELVFLDISASKQNRTISTALVEEIGGEANMPFAVGGGIRSLEDIRKLIGAGAEKVILNSHAFEDPELVRTAAESFGASTIAVCIDVKRNWLGGNRIYRHTTARTVQRGPLEYARQVEAAGAGELIVQSVDRDGTMEGYDITLLREMCNEVSIPVVALGGAGELSHLTDAYFQGGATALAAGSLFVYQSRRRGVLINYPSVDVVRHLFGTQRK